MTGAAEEWLIAKKTFADDVCLIWPFSCYANGYGQAWVAGRLRPAHRVMAELTRGIPPSTKHQAAHTCGVRNCVNPRHLRWLTQSENEMDKRAHGTAQIGSRNGAARLTEITAAEAKRRISSGESDRLIANVLGVGRKTISAIREGRTWRHVQPTIKEAA